jgi:hypothetical protein
VSDQAATPTGGAEVSARPQETSAPASVHDRLKAAIFTAPEPQPDPERPAVNESAVAEQIEAKESEPAKAEAPEPEVESEPQEAARDDAQPEAELNSVEELAEALGWDLDKVLGLDVKTKIDGKESKQRLRDIIKSHQLEGHLNQKLMTHAEEKKAFETERQNFIQTSQHKLQQVDAAVQIATKMLEGEFSKVDWQALQDTDPLTFNQKYVEFQQRQAQLNNIANLLGQERSTAQQQAAAQQQAYLQEQMQLMETKIPEWGEKARREKDLTEMAPVFKDTYGITEQELRGLSDHRELLVIRDAWQWQKLQKAKPAIVNKVRTAPKLLKPGTPQSKAANDNLQLQQAGQRLRASGKLSDATPVLKKLLFR